MTQSQTRLVNQELQIEQDMGFQRTEWVVQRAGWVGMALLILAALVGLLGRGPLSAAVARAGDGALSGRVSPLRALSHAR